MMKERHTLILACTASFLLSAFVVTAASLLLESDVPSLGSPKWQPISGRLNLAFIVAFVHSCIFGIPAFLWVRCHDRVTLFRCVGWGFVIGALPLGLLSFIGQFGLESASTGNIPTVIHHVPTLFGLWELAKLICLLGVLGSIGGAGFWVGLWATGVLPSINRTSGRSPLLVFRTIAGLSLSLAAASAVMYFIPAAAVDRSCHNMFRDGRREISPVINMNLDVPQSEWRDVREFFLDFSADHKLSFQDGEDVSGVGLPDSLMLDLCSDQGTNISVTKYHQVTDTSDPFPGVPISIFLFHENSGWKSVAGDFIAAIERLWPGKLKFQDGQGRAVPRPKVLDQQ